MQTGARVGAKVAEEARAAVGHRLVEEPLVLPAIDKRRAGVSCKSATHVCIIQHALSHSPDLKFLFRLDTLLVLNPV